MLFGIVRYQPIYQGRLEGESWEDARKCSSLPAVNGYTGILAYRADNCMCLLAGWPYIRDDLTFGDVVKVA